MTALAALLLAGVAVTYAALAKDQPVTARSGPVGEGPRIQVLTNGRLSTVSRSDPGGPREVTELRCDRAYTAAGTVACLKPVGPLSSTGLVVLDSSLHERRSLPLTGFPNRLRVSATGRMVAWTLFIDGHSYATTGFSTVAGILDTRTGRLVKSLEDFAITVDGRPYRNPDVNFWGVTFTGDDNRFYATLSTDGRRHLVEGDFAAKTVRTLRENVECPSLSPDGTRIAYKSAVDADPGKGWRLSVLDLASLRITALAETRSVDDQAAWLDDRTVAYALQTGDGTNNTWSVPADGTGAPSLLVPDANSPAPSETPADG
ncbi:TolB family protein [Streptosporangium carneum]|uniref:TolB-like translocation protein signal peptide n=1 Tax=Streptosporangium carneum TaxID=47481 RepID=A0A9W6MHH8_9ACTN|nr:hypothetical protein [Streptosporangium carneum]GLK14053.1 TolB-like translocation protein; signal peptide [Streptosporangium carneum]